MTLPAGKTPEMSSIRIDVVIINVGQKNDLYSISLNTFSETKHHHLTEYLKKKIKKKWINQHNVPARMHLLTVNYFQHLHAFKVCHRAVSYRIVLNKSKLVVSYRAVLLCYH